MPVIKLPYDKSEIEVDIAEKNLAAVLCSGAHDYHVDLTQQQIVEKALDNPLGSNSLEELVRGKKDMVIITSDHTRPVPSKITMPILLRRIREANPEIKITVLIATGFHRPTTKEEMINKFGKDIVENEVIVNHYSQKKEELTYVGILPSGGELWLNKLAIDTELLISEGFIEPHFFAGFSGGRKSILPGIAGAGTIMWNHNSQFINSQYARTGVLKHNPINEDMLYAAKAAKLAFILNVVIDKDKNIIHAVSGHSEMAHAEGCKFVSKMSSIESVEGDIVITSNGGYPLDQNIYQSVKGMTAAEACCKKDSVIIMAASCKDGHGGESFYRNMAEAKTPQELLERIVKLSMDKTEPDQWEFQILARVLSKCKVIMVSEDSNSQIIKDMHMEHSHNLQEALARAYEIKGRDAKVVVIPDGVSVVVNNTDTKV